MPPAFIVLFRYPTVPLLANYAHKFANDLDVFGIFCRKMDRRIVLVQRLKFNRLVHYDMKTGSRNDWGEDRYLLGEPILAPRTGSAGEGDGYILMLAYDQTTSLNDLLIFDASDIEAGPIAKAKLPLRIPSGFHGTWVAA